MASFKEYVKEQEKLAECDNDGILTEKTRVKRVRGQALQTRYVAKPGYEMKRTANDGKKGKKSKTHQYVEVKTNPKDKTRRIKSRRNAKAAFKKSEKQRIKNLKLSLKKRKQLGMPLGRPRKTPVEKEVDADKRERKEKTSK